MGKVLKVQINETKGEPPIVVESCTAVKGSGIQGDRHTGKGKREVCLCRKEILDWMETQEIQGLCFARHKENLLIQGFADGELIPGRQLAGKEAVLEISDFPEHCFVEECDLAKAGIRCRLKEEYQMAWIVQSGTIRTGEELTLKEAAPC